jgi:hypothetical protein
MGSTSKEDLKKAGTTERKPMSPNRIETAEDLERIVAKQTEAIDALTELVKGMDLKLRRYVQLVDIHEAALERVGIIRPSEGNENSGGIVH